MNLEVVILAAGKGTRMRSALPKVLHAVAGKALLAHVIDTAQTLKPQKTHVVYGFGGEVVPTTLASAPVQWVLQAEQKGTGHAVQQAMPQIGADAVVLILYGDVPLTRRDTLAPLVEIATAGHLALLTMELADAAGYGRIVRDAHGRVAQIVEHKDASPAQRDIREINTGIIAVGAKHLWRWLAALKNNNAQGEYYLTDIVAMAVADGVKIETRHPTYTWEIMGVNSKQQLAELERIEQANRAQALMEQGVTLLDPTRIDVRGTLVCGQDVVIDVNCVFEGDVVLGDRVRIGANNVIRNARIGSDSIVQPQCVIEDARIGDAARIGPFARIRPDTELAAHVHIGNFVEIKKSQIGEGSKVNHLSYIGDSSIGSKTNIGAGVITCNYDGANKHRTVIGNDVFVGSDCQLVAPVTIGDGATIGAGTTVTRDAPASELTLGRVKQKSITGWKRPTKKQ